MMPVSTLPNAIIFGTRRISIARMCKTGLWLNLLAIAVISVLAVLLH
jgi:solute carrier family 13 (sodium-dependent dicarboxylate transporter), member 2/3/5